MQNSKLRFSKREKRVFNQNKYQQREEGSVFLQVFDLESESQKKSSQIVVDFSRVSEKEQAEFKTSFVSGSEGQKIRLRLKMDFESVESAVSDQVSAQPCETDLKRAENETKQEPKTSLVENNVFFTICDRINEVLAKEEKECGLRHELERFFNNVTYKHDQHWNTKIKKIDKLHGHIHVEPLDAIKALI